ncbi:uncharacterized protein LOC122261876 [Penaeus japonicus]|uniref:uncharacterized protein LOC122261876 n=1 Tax=Penaeus japonicus TaxID=27405 RepID=UPI001C7104C6|nr:uncharacterized protein LOC122261876 [Penaeus japonicus]
MSSLCGFLALTLMASTAFASSCPSDYRPMLGTCVQVVIAARAGEFPIPWEAARKGCRERGGDLVSLTPPELLEVISGHIDFTWPGHIAEDYTFWVGGQKVGSGWQWLNGHKLSLQSHLWVPGLPPKSPEEPLFARLVPADSLHGRRYLNIGGPSGQAPAYICQAPRS